MSSPVLCKDKAEVAMPSTFLFRENVEVAIPSSYSIYITYSLHRCKWLSPRPLNGMQKRPCLHLAEMLDGECIKYKQACMPCHHHSSSERGQRCPCHQHSSIERIMGGHVIAMYYFTCGHAITIYYLLYI